MITKCKVLMNNEAITVADVDGIHVQFPSIHRDAQYVSVFHEGGDFHIVDDDEAEKLIDQETVKPEEEAVEAEPPKKRTRRKKTVVEETQDE